MEIRIAKPEDIDAIGLIGKLAYVQAYENAFGIELAQEIAATKYNDSFIQSLIESKECEIVVYEDEVILGLSISHTLDNVAIIDDLYVFPKSQKQGIGESFIKYYLSRYKDLDTLTISIESHNTNALRFCEKQGFEISKTEPSMIDNIPIKLVTLQMKIKDQ